MKRLAFAAAAVLAVVGRPARADEAAANFVKLFSDVCVAKFGHLDLIEDWAKDQNLLPITNPKALAVFAGRPNRDGTMTSFAGGGVPGSGKAWAVHDPGGAVSWWRRGSIQSPASCGRRRRIPGEVDAAYAKMVAQAAAPGTEVKLASMTGPSTFLMALRAHSASTACGRDRRLNSYALVLATVSRSGGPVPGDAGDAAACPARRPDQSDGAVGAAGLGTTLFFALRVDIGLSDRVWNGRRVTSYRSATSAPGTLSLCRRVVSGQRTANNMSHIRSSYRSKVIIQIGLSARGWRYMLHERRPVGRLNDSTRERNMSWTTPVIVEVCVGMEGHNLGLCRIVGRGGMIRQCSWQKRTSEEESMRLGRLGFGFLPTLVKASASAGARARGEWRRPSRRAPTNR